MQHFFSMRRYRNFGNIWTCKPSLSPRCFKSSLKLSKHVSDNEGKSVLVHEFAIRMSKSTSNFLTKERRWFWGKRVDQLLWFSPNNSFVLSMSVCHTESRSFQNISCLKHKKDSTSALQERRLHLNETLFWKFSPKVSNLIFELPLQVAPRFCRWAAIGSLLLFRKLFACEASFCPRFSSKFWSRTFFPQTLFGE